METPNEIPDVELLRLSLADAPHPSFKVKPFFDEAVNFVNAHNGPIIIHCFGGQNRSPAVCVAILMKVYGMKFEEAEALVAKKRQITKIGPIYKMALENY